jgi:FAD:protein FMN transferase
MKKTNIIMGMPITVEVVDTISGSDLNSVFTYFKSVDKRFSTYKAASEISKINKGLPKKRWSEEMKELLALCEETKKLTKGYFDIDYEGKLDPSGLVKGWAVHNAVKMLLDKGLKNFYIEAGGDIQAQGMNLDEQAWAVGIRNPFNIHEIVKVVRLSNQGMATSGTYVRGQHVYNPHNPGQEITNVKSLSVIADNVYEADRYATAAFAMGDHGIGFIEETPGLEGYMVNSEKVATYTSGFERYVDTDA